ncbi:MAG TPA: hypothetical protein VD971_06260 [Phycisphaerales bacterium]|nr:hypothetical protein [Phycisphaerales bacterium]
MNFKNVLAWVKANLVIVICSALILIILPVSFIFSNSWMKSVLAEREKQANDEYKKVTSTKITYTVPQFDPKVEAVSLTSEPNPRLIEHFRRARDEAKAKVDAVAKQGEEFNRGAGPVARAAGRTPHTPLVEGLFPKVELTDAQRSDPNAARDAEQAKLYEMEDRLLGKRGHENPYEALLKSVRAGAGADNARVAEVLTDMFAREKEKITSGTRDLTPEEKERLNQQLQDRRLAEYQSRARALSLYATMDVFGGPAGDAPGAAPAGRGAAAGQAEATSAIPRGSISDHARNRSQLFLHQWDLWLLQDLFAAVRAANSADGKLVGIDQAVVKRIEKIDIMAPEGMKPLDATGRVAADPNAAPADPFASGGDAGAAAPPAPGPGMVPLDTKVSFTGRARGGWNPMYEVRRVRVTGVFSSARINEFFDALARTNFMTVTDVDVSYVDVFDDLRQGYYYGDEHVVRATVSIETVWLKSWLIPLMPRELQEALGMTPPPEAAEGDPAANSQG